MPKSTFVSKVKKMDITNKVAGNHWKQSIAISLGEIALNDDNLVAIRKFRPDEEVIVTIEPLQRNHFEEMARICREYPTEGEIMGAKGAFRGERKNDRREDAEEFYEIVEDEGCTIEIVEEGKEDDLKEGEVVLRSFEF